MKAGLANNYSRPQTNKYFTGQASLPQLCSSKQQDVYSLPSEAGKLQRVNGTCTPQQAAEAAAKGLLKHRKNVLSTVKNVLFLVFQTNKVKHKCLVFSPFFTAFKQKMGSSWNVFEIFPHSSKFRKRIFKTMFCPMIQERNWRKEPGHTFFQGSVLHSKTIFLTWLWQTESQLKGLLDYRRS